jgi:hypothetical protein
LGEKPGENLEDFFKQKMVFFWIGEGVVWDELEMRR